LFLGRSQVWPWYVQAYCSRLFLEGSVRLAWTSMLSLVFFDVFVDEPFENAQRHVAITQHHVVKILEVKGVAQLIHRPLA